MSAPVPSAVVNLSTLPESSSGGRNAASSAESRSASHLAPGSSTARFTVRSANSLSLSNLRRQRHVSEEEEAGRAAEREVTKQGKAVGEPARGESAVQQPHAPRENSVRADVRERGRAPSRVKFTLDTKIANDTGATTQSSSSSSNSSASDVKDRLGSDGEDPGKASGGGGGRVGSARGRSEWRKEGMQSRSKSLDWRGGADSRGRTGTEDLSGASSRRAESLERREGKHSSLDRRAYHKDLGEFGSLSSRIQAYRAASGSEKLTPSLREGVTGTSSLRLNNRVVRTLDRTGGERSLPLRLRSQDSPKSPEEGSYPWKLSSQDHSPTSLKLNEVTGNKSIWDRIEKLYGTSGPDDQKTKRHSAPVGDWLDDLPSDFHSTPAQRKLSSDTGPPSYSSHGPTLHMSHSIDRRGTFPRRFSQSDHKSLENRSYFTDSISRKDTSPTPTTPVTSASLRYRERSIERKTLHQPEVGLYTKSLDRSRSRLSATAQFKQLIDTEIPSKETSKDTVSLRLKGAAVVKERSLKEEELRIAMDKDSTSRKAKESVTANRGDESRCKLGKSDGLDKLNRAKDSQGTLDMASKTSPTNMGKIPTKVYSSDKGFASSSSKPHTTPAKEPRNAAEDEDVFDTRVKDPIRKQDSEKAKGSNPSIDSVRSTIHKFEALAHQSHKPSQFLKSRRFLTTPEDPKDRGGLKKSESDHALARRMQEGRSTQNNVWVARSMSVDESGLKLDNCDTSEVGLKIGSTKSPSKVTDFQSLAYPQKDVYKRGKDMDEPDSSAKPLTTKAKFTIRNSVQRNSKPENTVFLYHKNNHNNNSNGTGTFMGDDSASLVNISKVSDASEDDSDKTPTNSPDRLPLLPDFNGQMPAASEPHVSSLNNIRHPSDADSEPPTPTNSIHSARGPLLNHDPKGLTDCPPLDRLSLLDKVGDAGPFSASVVRWSSDEEDEEDDDDDDDEGTQKDENSDYDSDSGESSVTITSNMSRRSFSVSLADLCTFGGVDYSPTDDSEDDADDWPTGRSASLSSDASAMSCVTLLDSEELDSLLQDVQSLGEDTLQNYNDVQVVVLHKEVGTGLGFTVAGGVDQNKPVTVHKVFLHGVASQEGSIQVGDLVLSINGTTLQNCGHWEALRTLRKARGRGMAVVVLQKGVTSDSRKKTSDSSREPLSTDTGGTGRQLRVTLRKRSSDLGFSLEGGVGSSMGDRPLMVQKLFHGDPVGDVCAGDELLEIQGQSMTGLRRLEAWQLIKKLPPGPVDVLLRRPHKPH